MEWRVAGRAFEVGLRNELPFEKYEGKRFQKSGLGRVGVVTLGGSSVAEGFAEREREREREREG